MTHAKLAAITTAVAGALSLALAGGAPAAGQAAAASQELSGFAKCYGIALAGQNSCANAAGTHDCAGQSTVDYSGQEWRAVKRDVCHEIGGKLEPFAGVGHPTHS
jgi:uncharacterized membrane protein